MSDSAAFQATFIEEVSMALLSRSRAQHALRITFEKNIHFDESSQSKIDGDTAMQVE